MRPGGAADRAVVEAGSPARDGEGPQEVGVQHELRGMAPGGERVQRTHEEEVLLRDGFAGVVGQADGGLHHHGRARVELVVGGEEPPVGVDRLHLGDNIEAAAAVQLGLHEAERLQACPDP